MARGMLRGAAVAWLGLIALDTFTSKNGADAVGGLLGVVNGAVTHLLDPTVPAIPDKRPVQQTAPTGNAPGGGTSTVGPNGKPNGGQITPGGQYLPPTDQTTPQPNPIPVVPDSYIPWPSVPRTLNA